MTRYVCTICGYIYDEDAGIPSAGIAPGTKWEQLPDDWKCPLCGAAKSDFRPMDNAPAAAEPAAPIDDGEYRELSVGELSALCSNLARGCDKQYLSRERQLFTELADYFKAGAAAEPEEDPADLLRLVESDLNEGYVSAEAVAKADGDRGAQRVIVWGTKVSRMLSSILARYEKEGSAMLESTGVWVCTICGFVYIGDEPPEKCPVCSVPPRLFKRIERRAVA